MELLVFIIITSLLMSTMLLGMTTALRQMPSIHQQWIASQVARGCMEWFLQQFRLNGYTIYACPSTPSTSACSAPSGYTMTTTISCTTWNSDSTYKTIQVAVSGLGNASLSAQIGND